MSCDQVAGNNEIARVQAKKKLVEQVLVQIRTTNRVSNFINDRTKEEKNRVWKNIVKLSHSHCVDFHTQ